MSDPQYRLHKRISRAIWQKLRQEKGGLASFGELLDFSLDELRAHLERQFLPGMGWHNIDEWHVDHIIPQASFTFDSPEDADFKACWALTNLRPLWGERNLRKGARRLHLL